MLALVGGAVAIGARLLRPQPPAPSLARGNGRLEAVEIDIATRTAGRISAITVEEGEPVVAGQIVARMDTSLLDTELREADAERRRAVSSVETASGTVRQREQEWQAATATQKGRQAEFVRVRKRYERVGELVGSGALPSEEFDNSASAASGVAVGSVANCTSSAASSAHPVTVGYSDRVAGVAA